MHAVLGDYILAVEITYIVARSTLRSIPCNGHGIFFLYEHVTKIMDTVQFCHTPDPSVRGSGYVRLNSRLHNTILYAMVNS